MRMCRFSTTIPSYGISQPQGMLVREVEGARRYVKSMRPLQKLRDEEWWGETMAGLRPTLQQSTQPQRRLAHTNSLKASTPQLSDCQVAAIFTVCVCFSLFKICSPSSSLSIEHLARPF